MLGPFMTSSDCKQCTLYADIARLRGIVNKLPKCWGLNADGELVQDVPVVPGMKLWDRNGDTLIVAEVYIGLGTPHPFAICGSGRIELNNSYSTPEAAEAAEGDSP